MSEVFSVLLHNRQRYEQGKEGLWFSLPTTTEKLQAALREIGISTDNPQDFFLYGYRSPQKRPIKLPRDMVLSAGMDELNFLAARLEKLDAAELTELNAALTSPQSDFHNIGQIIDYPENVDFYVHLPDVTSTGQLGDYYRSYEELQADGLSVDRKNYQLIYSAPLDKDITLDEIYRRFNMEHPADYKGHSLSMGDIVVFRQDGKQTAYYVDEGADYRQVPEFFAQPEKQLTPDECMTGEQIQTPRGRFYLTDRSREQMEAAGYGFHHQSEDGRYLIMANGTRAFAIPAQPESHIKTAEMSTEQNYNMIDGMMNNAPSMEELEARAKAGEQISLLDVAEATKAEAKKPKQTQKTTQKQKKPSIRAQLAAAKEEQKKKPPAREKSKEMEV